MSTKLIKAGWHILLVAASIIEYRLATTQLKKHLALACAGWHVSAAIVDLKDK